MTGLQQVVWETYTINIVFLETTVQICFNIMWGMPNYLLLICLIKSTLRLSHLVITSS